MIVWIINVAAIVLVVGVWFKLRRVFSESRPKVVLPQKSSDDDLPTVSLCIPARDEVHAMTDCLESALRSDYPKLEIIVLDDGSRDETLNLVKAFAHSGVRFIEGKPLPEGWLGKNHALEVLSREASGSLLLFADVDTRFSPDSIRELVDFVLHESADMVSILPTRYDPRRASAVFATMRHFWSLLSHSDKHPAVASSAWMIKRALLLDTIHGFGDVSTDVRPDKSIAAIVSRSGSYRFLISTAMIGVSYEKKLSSQYETAIRIYYPDFGFAGIIGRCLGLLLCLFPYGVLIYGVWMSDLIWVVNSIVAISALSFVNRWYLRSLNLNRLGMAVLIPFVLAREIWLLVGSVVMYRLGRVTWKGRPVRVS